MTDEPSAERTVSWRELLAETFEALTEAGIEQASVEARWIIQTASGFEGAELVTGLDQPATQRGVAHLDSMVQRRQASEPLQYVLGSWGFRTLDLLCDRRALIPRPETEQVVEVALAELDRHLSPIGDRSRSVRPRPVVVDLGTGTGAIALSIAVERPDTEVWAVDASADALAVARANLAGLGMAGGKVRLAEGQWFAPLPPELRGELDLVVANPPYIGTHEELPRSVSDWEPIEALRAGPSGLECYEQIVADAPAWLAPGASLVLEIGSTQGEQVCSIATSAGFVGCRVEQDHAGLDRVVVAVNPAAS